MIMIALGVAGIIAFLGWTVVPLFVGLMALEDLKAWLVKRAPWLASEQRQFGGIYIMPPDGSGEPVGPFSINQIMEKVRSREIAWNYLWAREGEADWRPVQELINAS